MKKDTKIKISMVLGIIVLLMGVFLFTNMVVTNINNKVMRNKTIAESNKKYVHELELNQTAVIDTNPWMAITKVPGGLLYRTSYGVAFVPDVKEK